MSSDVITRVQRLIALAASSNEHEARTAAHKACALIREHKLVISGDRPSPIVGEVDFDAVYKNRCAFCGARKPCECVWGVAQDIANDLAGEVDFVVVDGVRSRAYKKPHRANRASHAAKPVSGEAWAVACSGFKCPHVGPDAETEEDAVYRAQALGWRWSSESLVFCPDCVRGRRGTKFYQKH